MTDSPTHESPITFEVRRTPDDPTRWQFTVTQPATVDDVDPQYRAVGDEAVAALTAFCTQQLAGLGILPQDVARMILDRISPPTPPSEVA